MASSYHQAVQQELNDQPTWLRYKGSIIIVVSGVAGILSQLAAAPEIADTSLSMGLTAAATIIAFLLNRFTKDGITPSAAHKLETAGMRAYADRPGLSGVPDDYQEPDTGDTGLPVYQGDTTAEDFVQGRHRAEE